MPIKPITEPQPPADRPPRKSIRKIYVKPGKPFKKILKEVVENGIRD